MSEVISADKNKIRAIKGLIRSISKDQTLKKLGFGFGEFLKNATDDDFIDAGKELVDEGLDPILVDLGKDKLRTLLTASATGIDLPPAGHPIHILMKEHEMLLELGLQLNEQVDRIQQTSGYDDAAEIIERIYEIAGKFTGNKHHYLREENVLFPYLEKHGITGPPKVMWIEHDRIRELEGYLKKILNARNELKFPHFVLKLHEISTEIDELFNAHFNKENSILFDAALRVIDELEWVEIRNQFDEIGYTEITSEESIVPMVGQVELESHPEPEGGIVLETGEMSGLQLQSMLNALPVDLTFIDDEDVVQYFNQTINPIFTRMKAVIGTKVQNCHPGKSVHMVDKIIGEFRSGERDLAEFWVDAGKMFIHIRFYALRDKSGKYLGCVEVTQDVAGIKKLEGEKRLI